MEEEKDYKKTRHGLRILAWVVLSIEITLILKTKIMTGVFYIDKNDGYVIIGCLAILLAIEGVRAFVLNKLKQK